MRRAPIPLVLAAVTALTGCATFADFAPQTPDPSPPAVEPMRVELVIDGSRPTCDYRVIGSVFAMDQNTGLDALRQRAAMEGGSGVYDIHCSDASRTALGGRAVIQTQCTGRVYVCQAGKG